jgi:hypothetical protein
MQGMKRRKKKKKCDMKGKMDGNEKPSGGADGNSKEDMKEAKVKRQAVNEPPPIEARTDDDDELEAKKRETPAVANELKDTGGQHQDRTNKTVMAFTFQNAIGQKMGTHGNWTYRYLGKDKKEETKIHAVLVKHRKAMEDMSKKKTGYNVRTSIKTHKQIIKELQQAGIHGQMHYGHQSSDVYEAIVEAMNMDEIFSLGYMAGPLHSDFEKVYVYGLTKNGNVEIAKMHFKDGLMNGAGQGACTIKFSGILKGQGTKNTKDRASAKKYIEDVLTLKEYYEPESDFEYIMEAMKRRKKRDAHGRVKKFYKRTSDCPPGKIKNRKGGCDKIGGNISMQARRKTIKVGQRKRKKTLKKKSGSFWRMADMRRKKTKRA